MQHRFPLGLLILLMLLPWGWTSLGLFVLHDFRMAVGLYEVMGCLLPFYLLRHQFPSCAFGSCKSWLLWGLILLGNLFMLGGFLLFQDTMIQWSAFLPRVLGIGLDPGRQFWGFGLYFVLFNPFIEELFWRGLVYNRLKDIYTPRNALLISSFFFGLWHWVIIQHYFTPLWALWITFMIMTGGVLFGWLYEKTGSLMPSILLHGLGADLPIVFIFYMSLARTQGI